MRKLGKAAEAEALFKELADTTEKESPKQEAVESGQPARSRAALAHYVTGLTHLGLGDAAKAKAEFELALKAAPDLLGAKVELGQK